MKTTRNKKRKTLINAKFYMYNKKHIKMFSSIFLFFIETLLDDKKEMRLSYQFSHI